MADFYCDLIAGNDSNTGLSWAQAKKTLLAFTSPVGGDRIKIAKTASKLVLTQTAVLLNNSQAVTVTGSLDLKEVLSQFGAGTRYNGATGTTRTFQSDPPFLPIFQGQQKPFISIPGSVANTKYASWTFSTLNLSAYQGISFWFSHVNGTPGANKLRVCLCSDTVGDTVVANFVLDLNQTLSLGIVADYIMNLDFGGNLPASVQSIAIYSGSSPSAGQEMLITRMLAYKTNPVLLPGDWFKVGSDRTIFPVSWVQAGDTAARSAPCAVGGDRGER